MFIRPPFLVLGRAGMDLYADPPGTRLEDARQFTSALGGSAANIAAGLARLGQPVSLISAVSDDAVGRFVLNELKRFGIGSGHVHTVAGEARNSLAVVETRAENCQSVIYRNGAADFEISLEQIAGIDFKAFGTLILTGTALANEPSRSATLQALERAKAAGLSAIIDVDHRPYSWIGATEAALQYNNAAGVCDIVIGNDDEFAVMAGAGNDGSAFAEAMAKDRGKIVIYKMGANGSTTFHADKEFKTGIFPVAALKPTGAGDAFMAGFVAGCADARPLPECVRRGSAAAAVVVTRVGCAPAAPTLTELEAFLANRASIVL